eukprot:1300929-Prorocentrum_lima.AAC.1
MDALPTVWAEAPLVPRPLQRNVCSRWSPPDWLFDFIFEAKGRYPALVAEPPRRKRAPVQPKMGP